MFPRFREQIGTALDLVVEFSTLGEYRLGVSPTPGAPGAPADAPGHAPRMGGAGHPAERAAVRVGVAGGPAGTTPVATPAAARRHVLPAPVVQRHGAAPAPQRSIAGPADCHGDRRHVSAVASEPRHRARTRKGAPVAPEQLCLAV